MIHRLQGFRSALFFISLIALTIYSASPVRAQAGQAELTGIISDVSGAGLAGARVTITETLTNRSFDATSNDEGLYVATNLKPGLYTITVTGIAGFNKLVREGVRLATGERVNLDLELPIAAVTETVVVREDASLLRTESSSLGQVIGNRKITDIPLNGRNFLSLVALSPGVAQPPPTSAGASFPRINGGRPRVNEYVFDGISVLQPEPGQVAFNPIVDAIQEFKVEINSPSAEFGRFNGGVVNLTTKSGTNEVRGSAFYFLRNEVLNARNLFQTRDSANQKKPVFRRNQYGFVIGAPIVKDKTFFFVSFQGTRQSVGRTLTSTVPTLAQRAGDFSSTLGAPLFLQNNASGVSATTANTGTPILVTDTQGASVQARVGQIFRRGSDRQAYCVIVPIPLTTADS